MIAQWCNPIAITQTKPTVHFCFRLHRGLKVHHAACLRDRPRPFLAGRPVHAHDIYVSFMQCPFLDDPEWPGHHAAKFKPPPSMHALTINRKKLQSAAYPEVLRSKPKKTIYNLRFSFKGDPTTNLIPEEIILT